MPEYNKKIHLLLNYVMTFLTFKHFKDKNSIKKDFTIRNYVNNTNSIGGHAFKKNLHQFLTEQNIKENNLINQILKELSKKKRREREKINASHEFCN